MSATLNHVLSDPNWAADEIDRLRDALESLTEDPPATLDEPDEDWEVIVKMRAIAREALDAGLPTAEDVRGILAVTNGDRQ